MTTKYLLRKTLCRFMLSHQKFSIIILVLIVFTLSLLGYLMVEEFKVEKNPNLEVVFLDIGQGDAILIKTPYEQNILIDGGPDNSVVNRLGRNLPFYDKEIDLMILTHPDADHVYGLPEVLNRYWVDKVLYTGVIHTSPGFLEWLDIIEKRKIPMEIAVAPQRIDLGEDLYLEILWPDTSYEGQRVEDNNYTSIAARLVYGQTAFMFTGDATIEVEEKLLQLAGENPDSRPQEILRADVLKAGHHGSKGSSSAEFIKAVSPEYAIISCGADNNFGHPHLRVLKNFEEAGVEILRTDVGGDIVCVSDKVEVECKYK